MGWLEVRWFGVGTLKGLRGCVTDVGGGARDLYKVSVSDKSVKNRKKERNNALMVIIVRKKGEKNTTRRKGGEAKSFTN